jgi:hypothetical protein
LRSRVSDGELVRARSGRESTTLNLVAFFLRARRELRRELDVYRAQLEALIQTGSG